MREEVNTLSSDAFKRWLLIQYDMMYLFGNEFGNGNMGKSLKVIA